MKNHCVRLRPAPPLAEARVTQLATASFRDLLELISIRGKKDHKCVGAISACGHRILFESVYIILVLTVPFGPKSQKSQTCRIIELWRVEVV